MYGSRRVLQCPYCPTASSEIAIDVDALLKWVREKPDEDFFVLQNVPEQQVVVFNPDHCGATPCEHLLEGTFNFSVDPEVAMSEAVHPNLTIDMTHTELASSDEDFQIFLYEEFFYTDPKNLRSLTSRPKTRHHHFNRSFRNDGILSSVLLSNEILSGVRILFAEDSHAFLDELQRIWNRLCP